MPLKVIGAGLGRTGTYSLKSALTTLGFGPCHHMEDVHFNTAFQVPLWLAALDGRPDWTAIYNGFQSAVDWPTARFFRELCRDFPDAMFILTTRSAESWAESFSQTIGRLLTGDVPVPETEKSWLDMVREIVRRSGVPFDAGTDKLAAAFDDHTAAVMAEIPARKLLVHDASNGWAPLCDFLRVPIPDLAYPRSNNRSEFWNLVGVTS